VRFARQIIPYVIAAGAWACGLPVNAAVSPWNCRPSDTGDSLVCTENEAWRVQEEASLAAEPAKPATALSRPAPTEPAVEQKALPVEPAPPKIAAPPPLEDAQATAEAPPVEPPTQPEPAAAQAPAALQSEPAEAPAPTEPPAPAEAARLEPEPTSTSGAETTASVPEDDVTAEPPAAAADADADADVAKPAETAPVTAAAVAPPEETSEPIQAALPAEAPPSAPPEVAPEAAPLATVQPSPQADSGSAAAAPTSEQWELCGPPYPGAQSGGRAPPQDNSQFPIQITADKAEVSKDKLSTFTGNVLILQGSQELDADTVVYDRQTERVEATGNVRYEKEGIMVEGERATLYTKTDTGEFHNTNYRVADRHARGEAEVLIKEGPTVSRLKNATYTTCNPGDNDWYAKATRIKLDHAEGVGTAQHVTVRFKHVPIFYSPYMTFPLDDRRKSGFLTPSFGTSRENGTDIIVPYYWNIAPDRDATVTLRNMTARGPQLKGEFRYLARSQHGQVDLEHLPDDDKYNDDRTLFSLSHTAAFGPRWDAGVLFNYASDKDYFSDLGNSLSIASTTHLDRRATASYHADYWQASGMLESFQTIAPNVGQPYKRLPQITFATNLPTQRQGLKYAVDGEFVRFDRDTGVTGTRLDLRPSVSLPMQKLAWYATPKLTLRHTRYNLSNQTAGTNANPTRTAPVFSLDSGVFLERDMTWRSSAFLHTLEPRLFYLYVPHREQSTLPVFDTGLYDMSESLLFREDRFSGSDRVGDANQLSLGITTRFIDDQSGQEKLSATIGQIFYFRDRTVTLPGGSTDASSNSDIIARVTANPTAALSAGAELQWDTGQDNTGKSAIRMQYYRDRKHILNLEHRFWRDSLEQVDFSAFWAIKNNWYVIGRWNRSLRDNVNLEYLAGLEYHSCCWVVRLVKRAFVSDINSEINHALFLQLELKGLTGFGDDISKLLETGILGYERPTAK